MRKDLEAVRREIEGLIVDMTAKLEKQAGSEATEKAHCDEQMPKTEAKPARLKEGIMELELAALAKEQAEMDKIRQETHADYKTAKAELELGLNGVPKALDVLRDQYGAGAAAMLQDGAKFAASMQQPAMAEHHSKAQGAEGACVAGRFRGEEGPGLLEHRCGQGWGVAANGGQQPFGCPG